MKALANQTAKATEEISGQVEAMQQSTSDAVAAISGISRTIAQMSEIARNILSVAAGSSEISAHIGGVTTAATATGTAASEVLENARELDKQSGMLRSAVDGFLTRVRAA